MSSGVHGDVSYGEGECQGELGWGRDLSLGYYWVRRYSASPQQRGCQPGVMVEVRAQDTSGLGVYIWDALTQSWHLKLGDSGGMSLQEKRGPGWAFGGRVWDKLEQGTEDGAKGHQVCLLGPLVRTPAPQMGRSQLRSEQQRKASSAQTSLQCRYARPK